MRVGVAVSGEEMAFTPAGVIVGPIWLSESESGAAFPEAQWSDAPVVLLATWIPSLRRLAARGLAAECGFHEGPYHFVVTAAPGDAWRIACFERREGPSVANAVVEWTTPAAGFLESALAAGRAVLGHCDARQWWTADTDRLREAIAFDEPDERPAH